jgi:uncharacterized membrane protein
MMTTLGNDLLWVVGGLIILLVVWYLTRRHQNQQEARQEPEPRTEVINKTNYNIDNTGVEGRDYANLDAREAQRILKEWEAEDYIPSDEEFRRVQDVIQKNKA